MEDQSVNNAAHVVAPPFATLGRQHRHAEIMADIISGKVTEAEGTALLRALDGRAGSPAPPVQPGAEPTASPPAEAAELAGLCAPGRSIRERLGAPAPAEPAAPAHLTQPLMHFARGSSSRSSKIESQERLSFLKTMEVLQAHWHIGKLPHAEAQRLKIGTKDEKARLARDKDTWWWLPDSFTEPVRNAPNAVASSMVVLDFDGGVLTAAEISARLGSVTHAYQTTYSHSPDAPKLRVMIPLSREVNKEEHRSLFAFFMSLYPEPGAVDPSAGDWGRLWFFPSCTADMVEHREFRVIEGDGFCDVDVTLANLPERQPEATGSQLPESFAAREPIIVGTAHPNDALALPKRTVGEVPPEELRSLLRRIQLKPSGSGKRNPSWFKVVGAVALWGVKRGELQIALQILIEWCHPMDDFNLEELQAVFDRCCAYTGDDPITVGTLFSWLEEEDPPVDVLPLDDEEAVESVLDAPDGNSGAVIRAIKAQVEAEIAAGKGKQAAALAIIEADLVLIESDQKFYSLSSKVFFNEVGIKQKFTPAMPRSSGGRHLDPWKLLESSATKRVAASLDYRPGGAPIFMRPDGRWRANLYQEPPGPQRLAATDHVRKTLAQCIAFVLRDPAAAGRVLDKYAFMIQFPGERIPHATIVYGEKQGTGKTLITYDLLRGLLGDWNVTKVSQQELESNFSDYWTHTWALCMEEIAMEFARDARKLYEFLKDPLTSPVLRVHPKGRAGYSIHNSMSVFGTSNSPKPIALPHGDRRYDTIPATSDRLPRDLARDMKQILGSPDGCAQLRDIFLSRDVSKFDPFADPPDTAAKQAMACANEDPLEQELREMADDRVGPFDRDFGTAEEIRTALATRVRRLGETSPERLGAALKRVLAAEKIKRRLGAPNPHWYWVWRNQTAWARAPESALLDHRTKGFPPVGLIVDNTIASAAE